MPDPDQYRERRSRRECSRWSGAGRVTPVASVRGYIAGQALERIGKLYEIEREIRGQAADLRCEIRHGANPVIAQLFTEVRDKFARMTRLQVYGRRDALRMTSDILSLSAGDTAGLI